MSEITPENKSANYMFQSGINMCYNKNVGGGEENPAPNLVIAGVLPIYDYRIDSDLYNGDVATHERYINYIGLTSGTSSMLTSADPGYYPKPYEIGGVFITPPADNEYYDLAKTPSTDSYFYTSIAYQDGDTSAATPTDAPYNILPTSVTRKIGNNIYCNGYKLVYSEGGSGAKINTEGTEITDINGDDPKAISESITSESSAWTDYIFTKGKGLEATFVGQNQTKQIVGGAEKIVTVGQYVINFPKNIGSYKFNKLLTFVRNPNENNGKSYYPLSIVCFDSPIEYKNGEDRLQINLYLCFADPDETDTQVLNVLAEQTDTYWTWVPGSPDSDEMKNDALITNNVVLIDGTRDFGNNQEEDYETLDNIGVFNVFSSDGENHRTNVMIGNSVDDSATIDYENETLKIDASQSVNLNNTIYTQKTSEDFYGSKTTINGCVNAGNSNVIKSQNISGGITTNSFAFGAGNKIPAGGSRCFAFGTESSASGYNSFAFGLKTSSINTTPPALSVSIGSYSIANGPNTFSFGLGNRANNGLTSGFALVIGKNSSAISAVPQHSTVDAISISIGGNLYTVGQDSFSFGYNSSCFDGNSCVFGHGNESRGASNQSQNLCNYILGKNNTIYYLTNPGGSYKENSSNNIVIGSDNHAIANDSIVIGSGIRLNISRDGSELAGGPGVSPSFNNVIRIGIDKDKYGEINGRHHFKNTNDNSLSMFIRHGGPYDENGCGCGFGFVSDWTGDVLTSEEELLSDSDVFQRERNVIGMSGIRFYAENMPCNAGRSGRGFINGHIEAILNETDGMFHLVIIPDAFNEEKCMATTGGNAQRQVPFPNGKMVI